MKKIYLLLTIPLMFLMACEKESEGVSTIEKIPTITLNGDGAIYIKASKLSSTYDEIGYKELGATSDIGEVKVVNNIPKNNISPGLYYVKYVTTGENVIRTEKLRKVIIYEDDGILSGIYTAKVKRGSIEGTSQVIISTSEIDENGVKTYKCTDIFGGFFEKFFRGGWGASGVAASDNMKIDGNGNITGTGKCGSFGGVTMEAGKKIDADHLEWLSYPDIYDFFKVQVKLEKTKL